MESIAKVFLLNSSFENEADAILVYVVKGPHITRHKYSYKRQRNTHYFKALAETLADMKSFKKIAVFIRDKFIVKLLTAQLKTHKPDFIVHLKQIRYFETTNHIEYDYINLSLDNVPRSSEDFKSYLATDYVKELIKNAESKLQVQPNLKEDVLKLEYKLLSNLSNQNFVIDQEDIAVILHLIDSFKTNTN